MKRKEFIGRLDIALCNVETWTVACEIIADAIGLTDDEPTRPFKVGDRVVITQTGTAGTIATDDGPKEVQRYFVATRGNAGVWLDAEDIRHADPAPAVGVSDYTALQAFAERQHEAKVQSMLGAESAIIAKLRADLADMTKERDAAKAEAMKSNLAWEAAHTNSVQAHERAEKAERERDEAKAIAVSDVANVGRLIDEAVAAEREACAQLAEALPSTLRGSLLAEDIRARGEDARKRCPNCDGEAIGVFKDSTGRCRDCNGTGKVPA